MNERPPPPLIPRLWATQGVNFLGRRDSFRVLLMHTGGGGGLGSPGGPWERATRGGRRLTRGKAQPLPGPTTERQGARA